MWAVIFSHTESALTAKMIETNVHAILDAQLTGSDDALLIMRTFFISGTKVLGGDVALSSGISSVSR